jgi:hypothetical protein
MGVASFSPSPPWTLLRHNMVLGQKKSTEAALQIFIKSTQEAIEKKQPNLNFCRSNKSL